MMDGGSQPQGCSNSSHLEGSWIGTPMHFRGGEMSKLCNCGLRMVVATSKALSNPSKSFYDCPKYKVNMTNFFESSCIS